MTIQAPTRITIEVHPPQTGGPVGEAAAPIVRVVPTPAVSSQPAMVAEPREDVPTPAAYDPGPCTCLDDADCGADHAND